MLPLAFVQLHGAFQPFRSFMRSKACEAVPFTFFRFLAAKYGQDFLSISYLHFAGDLFTMTSTGPVLAHSLQVSHAVS